MFVSCAEVECGGGVEFLLKREIMNFSLEYFTVANYARRGTPPNRKGCASAARATDICF